jgi:SAM-dependent methyltransferase
VNRESLVPIGSDRRFVVQLGRQVLRRPRDVRHRINRENFIAWRRFRRATIRCNICGHSGTLLHEMPDLELHARFHIGTLRETLRCRTCFSKMRDRTLAAGLLDVMAKKFDLEADSITELAERMPAAVRVLDTDANGRIGRLLSDLPGYTVSLYQPDRENGADLGKGVVNVDLERMPFPDESFDVILSTEVMEHVRYVETAYREIARCLGDGGTYLFTVPYDASLSETWQLIDPETDEELVSPPHMHGDPDLRAEGIKSYRVFGRDITAQMQDAGLESEFAPMERPDSGIFAGDLFVATRRR